MSTRASQPEAYKHNALGRASGVCVRGTRPSAARVPAVGKLYPVKYKARAIELLVDHNATEAAATLNEEFPEHTITPNAVQRWAKALKIHLPRGRPAGVEQPKTSPNRDPIIACHAEGLTQAQTCVRLGLSRALVSKHWPKPPTA